MFVFVILFSFLYIYVRLAVVDYSIIWIRDHTTASQSICVRPKTRVWLDLEFGISILCKCYALLAYIAYQEIKYSDLSHLIMIMWILPNFSNGSRRVISIINTLLSIYMLCSRWFLWWSMVKLVNTKSNNQLTFIQPSAEEFWHTYVVASLEFDI